jgi:hypothetical protein
LLLENALDIDFLLSRKAISEVLKRGTNPLTPRQIRSFLAKYQLARALCGPDLARDPDLPTRLADGLAKAVFGDGLANAVSEKPNRLRRQRVRMDASQLQR